MWCSSVVNCTGSLEREIPLAKKAFRLRGRGAMTTRATVGAQRPHRSSALATVPAGVMGPKSTSDHSFCGKKCQNIVPQIRGVFQL